MSTSTHTNGGPTTAAEREADARSLAAAAPPERAAAPARRVISRDRTPIAFDKIGTGPAVIIVDGALCHRKMGPSSALAELLAPQFTVFTYDRRGRGESGDARMYSIDYEVDDIEALVREAGGTAYISGTSSGAVLALDAAKRLPGIKKVALYEAPLIVDDSRPTTEQDWKHIDEALSGGRRSDAIKTFMKSVGVPTLIITLMRLLPMWSRLVAVAHTLPYDGAIVAEFERGQPLPEGRWASVQVPVLVMDGGKSPEWMRHGNRALANVLPFSEYRTLAGQTHALKAQVHAPNLAEFFRRNPIVTG